jgi:formylglycine-generating enzyme required for sulfatase activity
VEWSASVMAGWTNFTGDHGQWLDAIPATGSGVITAAVPMFYRVVAVMPPSNMVYIPAGTFMMGNATNVLPAEEGHINELPQHAVFTDAFYVDKYELTSGLWNTLTTWDYHQGIRYAFVNPYSYHADNQPRRTINWYDSILFCNLRSEYDGLTPVYYTDPTFTNIYRSGELVPHVNWEANGYRLPTEAEWEKAARGGQPDLRYPWSDTGNEFSYEKANCDGSPYYNWPSPVGSFPPNDYGLYDMAGNVWEWVWDWYDEAYYGVSPTNNPRGPATGTLRIFRGGSYADYPEFARVSYRGGEFPDFRGPRCLRLCWLPLCAPTMKHNLVILLLLSLPFAAGADDLVIQAIEHPGHIVFAEAPASV